MRLRNIILLSMATVGIVSCDLNEYPQDSVSPETFFKTEKELKLYSNQFYTMLPDAEDMFKEVSDYVVHGLSYNDVIRGYAHIVPSTGGGWSFTSLRHINYFLQNIYRCEDEEVRKKYEGLALFWRAYFYFDKLQKFGDTPWYDQVLANDDDELLCKARDSRETIINHIMEDLDKAAAQLPETSDNKYIVNRYAALALKSRACLYEGTFRKYHAGDVFNPDNLAYADLLRKSANAAKEIMESGKYQLYTEGSKPYYDLFVGSATNEKEIILSRSYGVATHEASAFALVASKGAAGFTRAFALTYLMKDGTRFTDKDGYATLPFDKETENRDPRMGQTILTKGFTYKDGEKAVFRKNLSITGYPVLKYVEGPSATSGSHVDISIFRLAEVYLNYAEALAELGTITQDDLDKSINQLRSRAGMPSLSLADANANPDPLLLGEEYGYRNVDKGADCGVILEIRRERGIELVMEGFRYQDLVRWRELLRFDNQTADGTSNGHEFFGPYVPGKGRYDMDGDGEIDFVVNPETGRGYSAPTGVTAVTINKDIFLSEGDKGFIIALQDMVRRHDENRDYLYPLPLTELTLSKGALTQNPNWDDIDRK